LHKEGQEKQSCAQKKTDQFGGSQVAGGSWFAHRWFLCIMAVSGAGLKKHMVRSMPKIGRGATLDLPD
jgi:hypothetical protein